MEQNFLDTETRFNFEGDSVEKQRHPVSACQAISENDYSSFDCNICLDSAHDPVVTFCGHLYCWPCIYKWIHVRNSPAEGYQKQPTCPVCKANISVQSLIPLYGRGKSTSDPEVKKTNLDLRIPCRPTPTGLNTSVDSAELLQHYPVSYGNYTASLRPNTTVNGVVHPVIGLFGEMVYARIFGGSYTSLYAYPHSSALTGSGRRMRRQEMQLERSLNRLSIFFFCCIILCLILF